MLRQFPVPLGIKLKITGQAFGSASPDIGFWMVLRDPDMGPPAPIAAGAEWYEAAIYKKFGSNDGGVFEMWSDTSGQIYHIAYPATATNLIYIYITGWLGLREEFS